MQPESFASRDHEERVELNGGIVIRKVTSADDVAVARIIRTVMTEFSCNRAGFAIQDAEVDTMSSAYPGGAAQYFVVARHGVVLGAGGFGPLQGFTAAPRTCELRKMYFVPELRGSGAGARLLALLLERMRAQGYARCYLETTSQMTAARALYERAGFRAIDGPLGATGHHGCDRFYARDL